jgi:hypothetical protein
MSTIYLIETKNSKSLYTKNHDISKHSQYILLMNEL